MINPSTLTADRMLMLLRMRLHLTDSEALFEFTACHKSGDMAFLFVVHGGKPLVFNESYDLFPSDGLTAQLRLLRG